MVVGVVLGLLLGIAGIVQAAIGCDALAAARLRSCPRVYLLFVVAATLVHARGHSAAVRGWFLVVLPCIHVSWGVGLRARLPLADEQHRQAHGKVTRMSQAGQAHARPTSIAELRAVAQPPEVRGRRNAEHWTASLYLRDFSPYLTWLLLKTPISANGVTALMILVGWSTAAALLIPGIWGALLAVVLGQLQMLVDCCDGEVARWRRTSSPAGVFLDKVGHYTTEALIPLALGIRAAAYPLEFPADFLWTTLGALLALVIVLNKALNDMVHVARANAGLPKLADTHGETAPRGGLDREAPQGGALPAVPPALPLGRAHAHRVRRGRRRAVRRPAARRPRRGRSCCCRSRSSPCSGTSSRSWRHACPLLTAPPSPTASRRPRVGVVVLTMGTRPDDLARGIRSVLDQQDVDARRRVRRQRLGPGDRRPAAAGGREDAAPAREPRHPGRPQPRRARGARRRAVLPRRRRLPARCARSWPTDAACWPQRPEHRPHPAPRRRPDGPGLAAPVDPAHPQGRPAHSSNVFSCWEGAVLMPRAVFDATGGWADPFFYAHEGIELAWRVWDTGHVAWYAGDLVAGHPVIDPTRHAYYYRLNARNRVWLARRNLPAVLVPLYVGSWTAHPGAALGAATRGAAGVVRRLARGLARAPGGAAPDALAHGVADDARGPAAGRLTSRSTPAWIATLGRWECGETRSAPSSWPRTSCGRGAPSGSSLKRLADRPPLSRTTTGSPSTSPTARVNMYQIRQWYKPLAELAKRPGASSSAARRGRRSQLLAESPLPVAFVPTVATSRLHRRAGHPRRAVRQPEHAELPDVPLRAPLARVHQPRRVRQDVHDHEPVQGVRLRVHRGRAARERLARVLWDYDLDQRTIEIGRPQADHYSGRAAVHARRPHRRALRADLGGRPPVARTTGRSPSHGEALVHALLATGRHRVIYRPHPRSGVVDHEYGAANRAIIAAIAAANAADPAAHHVFDDGPELGWQLAAADVAIVDISAMVYDRLAAGRPLMVTRPGEPRGADRHARLPVGLRVARRADAAAHRRRDDERRARRGRVARLERVGRALLRRHDARAPRRRGSTRRSSSSWPSGSGTPRCTPATARSTSPTSCRRGRDADDEAQTEPGRARPVHRLDAAHRGGS